MISNISKARELSAGTSETRPCLKLIKKRICSYLKFQNYYIVNIPSCFPHIETKKPKVC